MIYKSFRFNVILRLLIILALIFLLSYVLTHNPTFFLPVTLFILLFTLIVNLVVFIEKSHRNLTHFLLSLRQSAFTSGYSREGGKPMEELSDAMNEIIQEFAKVTEEKELHYQYLQTLNESINVGIISFEKNGQVISLNSAAKELLKQPVGHLTDLRDIDARLYDVISTLEPEQKQIVRTRPGEHELEVSILAKEIQMKSRPVRIVLLHNLSDELQSREMEAWQMLVRVLTHEIMNSVTPIASLSEAAKNILTQPDGTAMPLSSLSKQNIEDIQTSVQTVSLRAKGLLRFTRAFKEYSKPLELKKDQIDLVDVVQKLVHLLKPDFAARNVSLEFVHHAPKIFIVGDRALLEQVVINILKNALDASKTDSRGIVSIIMRTDDKGKVSLLISDNGPGIDAEILPKIFVPFFTTKKDGTGVGLSFSRQVIQLHKGSIAVDSAPGEGTTFTIHLPAKIS